MEIENAAAEVVESNDVADGGEQVDNLSGFDPGGEPQDAPESGAERTRDEHGRFAKTTPEEDFERRIESLSKTKEQTPPADDASQPGASAAPSGEGPSADLLAVARLARLPDDVIGLAKDDATLRSFISMAERFQAPVPTPEPQRQQVDRDPPAPEEPLAKVLLSEEDFPKDDPYRVQAEHFAEAINKLHEQTRSDLDAVFQWANDTLAANSQNQVASEQTQFDGLMDGLNAPILGKRSEFKDRNDPAFKARNAIWQKYDSLKQVMPDVPQEQLAKFAYEAVFKQPPPTPQQSAKRAALIRQSEARQGGTPGRPAPEVELPAEERFEKKIEHMFAGRK